jgi:nitronate monooxygenase
VNLATLLNISAPLIQAPLAGVQDSALAVAVSNAGALGSLPCAMLSLDQLREQLQLLQAQTSKPYNVNFFCHVPPAPNPVQQERWVAALAPYYAELGIDPATIEAGPGRAPFSSAVAYVVQEFAPRVVSFHFGLPPTHLLQRVRGWGAKVLGNATTVQEALWLQAQGVDAVIAQGLEGGGHRGHFLSNDLSAQMGTLALLPQVVRALRIPVIAAGGIADAHGVRAAMDLGAAGVQVGTAYMLCAEATTSEVHRNALKSKGALHTALTNLFTGRPARGTVNRLMRELGPLCDAAPDFPMATSALAPLRAKAQDQGCGDFSPLWSGQNVSGCKEIGAAEMTRSLCAGFARTTVH